MAVSLHTPVTSYTSFRTTPAPLHVHFLSSALQKLHFLHSVTHTDSHTKSKKPFLHSHCTTKVTGTNTPSKRPSTTHQKLISCKTSTLNTYSTSPYICRSSHRQDEQLPSLKNIFHKRTPVPLFPDHTTTSLPATPRTTPPLHSLTNELKNKRSHVYYKVKEEGGEVRGGL